MKGYVTVRLLMFLNELQGRLIYSVSELKIHVVLHSYHIFTPKLALCLVFLSHQSYCKSSANTMSFDYHGHSQCLTHLQMQTEQ